MHHANETTSKNNDMVQKIIFFWFLGGKRNYL